MFTNLKLKNFQSFLDFEVEFMKNQKTPINLAVIYGENGVGKTNLINAFFMLQESFRTMKINEALKKITAQEHEELDVIKYINKLKKHYPDTSFIEKKYKSFNAEGNMFLEFNFLYNDKKGQYTIEYSDGKIVYEKLEYALQKRLVKLFEINEETIKIGKDLFVDTQIRINFRKQLKKYWSEHSFFAIFDYELNSNIFEYMTDGTSISFLNLYNFLSRTSVKVRNQKAEYGVLGLKTKILKNLSKGKLPLEEDYRIDITENILNNIITSLNSNVQQVFYEKEYLDDGVNYELHVTKLVNARLVNISVEHESTGTLKLLGIIPYILSVLEGNVVIIDETDIGIHDNVIHSLINNIKTYITKQGDTFTGQLITTTQNTYLLESNLLKENIYIFNSNSYGIKEIYPLTVFKERGHKTFNVRERYLKGLYGGTPSTKDIYFEEILKGGEDFMKKKKSSVDNDYLNALILTSSQYYVELISSIKQRLKLNFEIFGDNSSNDFKSLNEAFSTSTLVSFGNFKKEFENQLDFQKGRISNNFKIFIFIDTPNYAKKQIDYFVNKEMFIDHWAYEYIHPIYSNPGLEEILKDVNLLSFDKDDSLSYSDQLISLSKHYLDDEDTNISDFFDYCLLAHQNSNQI